MSFYENIISKEKEVQIKTTSIKQIQHKYNNTFHNLKVKKKRNVYTINHSYRHYDEIWLTALRQQAHF